LGEIQSSYVYRELKIIGCRMSISCRIQEETKREGKPGGKREYLHVKAVSHILYGGWKSDG
jgi:hypothetical protein